MIRVLRSIKWHAWVAAVGGLLAGGLLRSAFPEVASGSGAERTSAVEGVSRNRVGTRGFVQKSGPSCIFLDQIASAPVERCEQEFRAIISQNDPRRAMDLEAVFRRWMDLEDPGELLARLSVEPDGGPRMQWQEAFFEAWVSINYAEAVAGTAKDGSFAGIRSLVAIRRRDPSFLDGSIQIWNFDDSRVVNALARLGRESPGLAVGMATYQGRKPDQNADFIAAVARGWSAVAPEAALDWVKSLELTDSHRAKALDEVFSSWVKNDPITAGEAFKADGLDDDASLGFILYDTMQNFKYPDRPGSQVALAVKRNPFIDLENFYQELSASPVDWEEQNGMMTSIDHDGWFCSDPAAAAEEASQLPSGKVRDLVMSYICDQWADRSPDEATAFAKRHGLRDPWVREEPPHERILAALANPDETFGSFFAKGKGGVESGGNLMHLAQKWAAMEPQAAAEWLVSQPEAAAGFYPPSIMAKGMLDVALGYSWARVDAIGASNWVENLPDGPRKTEAWLAMNHYVGQYSPDLAFSISADLLEGESKLGNLETHLRDVAGRIGRPAARELLRSADLSEEERIALGRNLDELEAKLDTP